MNTQYAGVILLFTTLTLSGNFAAGATPSQGEAVLNRHVQALGGAKRLAEIQSQISSFEAQEGGDAFALEISFKGNDKVLLNASLPNGVRFRQARDGQNHCWRQTPAGLSESTDPKDLLDFRELSLCVNPAAVLDLQQRLAQLKLVGTEKLGARECQVLESTIDPGAALKLWFDSNSGLLTKVGNSFLEDYRAERGLLVAHLIRKGDNTTLKFKSVQFNVALDEAQFAKPAAAEVAAAQERMSQAQYGTVLNPGPQLGVARRPLPADFRKGALLQLPSYRPESTNPFQVDLRSADLSQLDVSARLTDLLHADFDSKTIWPAKLPAGFAPNTIMEQAKNPGLRVRELHRQGITGKGVGLAIIDQALLVDHLEYKDRLRSYEEIHSPAGAGAQMHGPAVASLAVGKSVGVAPEAELYYIAEMHGTGDRGKFDWDFTWLAKSIDRMLEINASLPSGHKIRVISISVGWSPGQKGCEETDAAVERARQAGVFVISTALERTHKLAFHGLGRDSAKDPDQYASYGLGSWWASMFLDGRFRFAPGERLLVPMDARTTASPTGQGDYVFYSSGGWSWSVPYLAGLYALACQLRPGVTPDLFWTTALKTGQVIPIPYEGKKYELGTIVDPVALMNALKSASGS